MESDSPQKEELYKPGRAALEYFEELDRIKEKFKPPVYKFPAKKTNKGRRRNPQRKIKSFFKDATNEDGYPLKHCEYEPEEGKMVYRPPNYGEEYDSRLPRHHCECCHLKPCILVVHGKGATDACFQLDRKDDSASAEKIVAEGEKFLMRKYCKYMKIRYSKKVPIPDCVQDRIEDFLYEWRLDKEDSSEEEVSDEEREFADEQHDDMKSDNHVDSPDKQESGDECEDSGEEREFDDEKTDNLIESPGGQVDNTVESSGRQDSGDECQDSEEEREFAEDDGQDDEKTDYLIESTDRQMGSVADDESEFVQPDEWTDRTIGASGKSSLGKVDRLLPGTHVDKYDQNTKQRQVTEAEQHTDEVWKLLLTQPFHGDMYSDDEEGCKQTDDDAFLDGRYIPKSLLRDRDVGDPPLELVVESHKKRIKNQRKAMEEQRNKASKENIPIGGSKATTSNKPVVTRRGRKRRAKSSPLKKKGRSRRARTSNGSFSVDLVSGLESDSSDEEELIALMKERRRRSFEVLSAMSLCTKDICLCWQKKGTTFNAELKVVSAKTGKLVNCRCRDKCTCVGCSPKQDDLLTKAR